MGQAGFKLIIKNKILLLAFVGLIMAATNGFAQQQVSLSTYMPSPFGAYDRLRLIPRSTMTAACTPGTLYLDQTSFFLKFCSRVSGSPQWIDLSNLWQQTGNLLYPTATSTLNSIGLGVANPTERLQIGPANYPLGTSINVLVEGINPALEFFDTQQNHPYRVRVTDDKDLAINYDSNENGSFTVEDNLLTFTKDGKLGIGTSSPQHLLHIQNDGGILSMAQGQPQGFYSSVPHDSTALIWNTWKNSFFAGDCVSCDATNTGKYSFTAGSGLAIPESSISIGNSMIRDGKGSIGIAGNFSTAWWDQDRPVIAIGSSPVEGSITGDIAIGNMFDKLLLSPALIDFSISNLGLSFGLDNQMVTIGNGHSMGSGSSVRIGWSNTTLSNTPFSTLIGSNLLVKPLSNAFMLGSNSNTGCDNCGLISLSNLNYSMTQDNSLVIKGGKMGINTLTPQVDLDVNGLVRLTPSTRPVGACTNGLIYFDNSDNHFYGCVINVWKQLDN